MAYRYVFQPLVYLNRRRVRWLPAGIYYGNATERQAPVERKSREAKIAKDFIQNISGLMSND